MLQLFAKVARETLRATDIIGRLGGEEFVALLPSAAAEAAIAAERVRAAFAVASIVRNGRYRCDGEHRGRICFAGNRDRFADHPR
jgi:diguanylate cyclase (GGDEF)-like protein